jgi:hypothetical protein
MTAPKAPQDHKKPAAQIEAEGVKVASIGFNGMSIEVPADPGDWPVEALAAFEDGKVMTALRSAMGASQWAAFLKLHPVKRDMDGLFEQLAESLGFTSSGN